MVVPYNLTPGADSAPISVPLDTPVFVIGNSTTVGDKGTGFISLERAIAPTSVPLLEWSGISSPTNNTTPGQVVGGFPAANGATPDMVSIDTLGKVTLRVTTDDQHFVVHNASAVPQTGFVWILPAPM
jgi:hypothetical protein